MIDPRLRKDTQAAESCKLKAYLDSKGNPTVGWGHLIPAGIEWQGLLWTQQQADTQLDEDLESASTFAKGTPEWGFLDTPCRQNAVIELCFNMRRKWLLFVNTRVAIRQHNWQVAHDELLKSAWDHQVHETRAERLANYLLTGQYPESQGV
jgi:GH24 family phage-related lysozyme (muramidase)